MTTLLPIRMALSIFPELSVTSRTAWARLLPSSARLRILSLLEVVRAVSADEKKAERASKITRMISCNTSLGSKRESTPFFWRFFAPVFCNDTAFSAILQEHVEFAEGFVYDVKDEEVDQGVYLYG